MMHRSPPARIPEHLVDIEAAQRGDPAARERLARRWMPVVASWCHRGSGPHVDPQDAAQDVFIVMLTRLHSLRSPERFPAWLRGVTRYVLSGHRRELWGKRWSGESSNDHLDPAGLPDERAAESQLCHLVQGVLVELPRPQREVLLLCVGEGRSSSEVAHLLGVPAGTVRSRLRLGRSRFLREAEEAGATTVLLAACG